MTILNFGRKLSIGLAALVVAAGHAAPLTVEVVTRILPTDPQAGMKSTQKLQVDFDKKQVTQTFTTGVTNIGVTDLKSIRDKFVVENVDFSDPKRAYFKVSGQTASGVVVMPNINYSFRMTVTPTGAGAVEGCHDGYPAYEVTVGSKKVYSFNHQSTDIAKLFGTCDTVVQLKSF